MKGQFDSTELAELVESAKNNSLKIMPKLTLIPFHRFSLSKISRILFSSNSVFSFVALYLKTKTQNLRKVSKSFIYCISVGSWLQCTDWLLVTNVNIHWRLLFKLTFIHLNFFQRKNWGTFRQFRVFVFDPIPENENAESAESSIKFSLLFQWYFLLKYWCLDT